MIVYYHYIFVEGKVSYRWEFNTYQQAFRVMDLLARTKGTELVYYQRYRWPFIMEFPQNVIVLPENDSNQFHIIRKRYLESSIVREEVPTFKAIEAGLEPCPICFNKDGSPAYKLG